MTPETIQLLISIGIAYALLRLLGVILSYNKCGISLTWYYNTFYPRSYREGSLWARLLEKVLDHFWLIQHDIKPIGSMTIDRKTGKVITRLNKDAHDQDKNKKQ
jgi:hypothetical protein